MVVPIPPSGVGSGWEDLGNGNMAARMTRFLQRDIDEGRIWYKNKGTAALTDIITFEVSMDLSLVKKSFCRGLKLLIFFVFQVVPFIQ